MKVLAIRYCAVSADYAATAEFFDALGLPRRPMVDGTGEPIDFEGAIFPAGDSWIELWSQGPGMPAGTMLQIVVDDADAFARHARSNGLEPQGPHDAHGERIYLLRTPDGAQISIQSALA